jgi:hypothetical protein
MGSTPDHRVVKRVLMQNILLQNMFRINAVTLIGTCFRSEAWIGYPGSFLVER